MKVQQGKHNGKEFSSQIVEIKARVTNLEGLRSKLQKMGAEFKGVDHQIDTYFNVPDGRFKLREGDIENNLIYYLRKNQKKPKLSEVQLYKFEPDSSLKITLTSALGVLVVVDKKREIYFIENVKFHLDTVKNLGLFAEIEAIRSDEYSSEEQLLRQCQYFMKEIGIKDGSLVPVSYSDLLLNQMK